MIVIVLSPEEANRWKYWVDLPVRRELGYWGRPIRPLPNEEKFRFRHNALPLTRSVTMAIFQGFIKIINTIVTENLENVLITEDDSIIDWDRFNSLDVDS